MTSPTWTPRANETSLMYFIFLRFSHHWDMQILLFSLFVTIYLLTIVGNSLILLFMIVDLGLHTPMYFFIRNLSFLEIFYTSVTKMLSNLLSEDRSISFASCAA
ncbi:unnamed protein product [Lepidochelys kempii]